MASLNEGLSDPHLLLSRVAVYIHLPYGLDRDRYCFDYQRGVKPDCSPYGFHLAEEYGFKRVVFSKDASKSFFGKTVGRLCRWILKFDLMHAFANRSRANHSNVIWVMTESEAFAISLLQTLFLIKRVPIIANAVWLLDEWHRISVLRKSLLKRLSKRIAILTVHSKACLPVAACAFPDVPSKLMYFGISRPTFKPMPRPPSAARDECINIFSAGNDKTRDWSTLITAFGNDPRFKLSILCSWLSPSIERECCNLTILNDQHVDVLLACYRAADIVVVSMRDNLFSGITVALEATALCVPLFCSRTGGVPTYYTGDEVTYFSPGDANDLKSLVLSSTAVSRMSKAKRALEKSERMQYDTVGLVRQYVDITQGLFVEPSEVSSVCR